MTQTEAELPPGATPKDTIAAPLGEHASRGVMWAMTQTLGSKGAGIVSQLILGYLLLDKGFGLAGLAFTLFGFVAVTQRFGLVEVLVQRHENFHRWVNAAFWMSLCSGLFSYILVSITALVAGRYYHDADLRWLILILGLITPLEAFATCPTAKLQKDLRFRTQNFIYFAGNVLQAALTILLAFMHWGAYAIIVPRPIVSLMMTAMFWWVAPVRVRSTLDLPRWRDMAPDGGALTMANYSGTVVQQGDNLTLSFFHSMQVVGVYFFAFNLSTQTGQLVATNLTLTFFSILSKLKNEVVRQAEAFLRAAKVVSLVMIPLCWLQMVVAGPMLRFLWGNKWEVAVPVLQVLSVGMAFTSTQGITWALFQAQGRFRFQLQWQLASAGVFLSCVLVGALSGGALAVALSVLAYDTVWYPLSAYVALRPAKIPLRRVAHIYVWPMLFGAVACGIAGLVEGVAGWSVPWVYPMVASVVLPARGLYLLQCIAISGLMLSSYALLVCLARPQDALLLTSQLRPVFVRLRLPAGFLRLRGEPASPAIELPAGEAGGERLSPARGVKILWMIDGGEVYGARRAVRSLMEGVRAAGWLPEAVSLRRGECADVLEKAGFKVTYLSVARPASLHLAQGMLGKTWQALKLTAQQIALSRRVRTVIRHSDAAAIHVVDKNVLPVTAWAARKENKACFWEMISIVGSGYPGDLSQRMHGWLIEHFGIVPLANSHYTAGTLHRVPGPVQVMYLGADHRQFDPERHFAVDRKKMGIPPEARVLTIVARVDESKGQRVFLQAMLTLQRPEIHLMIVGAMPGAPEIAELQAMARNAGAGDRVHFVELTSEPEAYLAMSDVVVNSRIDGEPFGLSTIEGMMMGKPLLVHALGGPAETVLDGQTGWHVHTPTVEGFAAGIERALSEERRWKAMGQAARERALALFSQDAQARWYRHAVLRALRSHGMTPTGTEHLEHEGATK